MWENHEENKLSFSDRSLKCLVIGLLLFAVMIGTIGAAGQSDTGTGGKVNVSAMMMQHPNNPWSEAENWLVFQELEDRTGVHFDFQGVPQEDYATRLSTVLATGDFPDLIQIMTPEGQVYGREGAFEPVNELARKYAPTYYAAINDPFNQYYYADENGDLYTVAFLMDPTMDMGERVLGGLFIDYRKDILEEMGETEPVTWDDWKELWAKVKVAYPDMIPLTTRARVWFQMLFIIMTGITPEGVDTFIEDDEHKYFPTDDRGRWVVEQMAELYADGILDQEFVTLQGTQWSERITAGQAFSMVEGFGRIDWANGLGRELNPDFTFWGAMPPTGPFGFEPKVYGGYLGPGMFVNSPGWGINPKISESKKEAIMGVVEYMSTPAGSELLCWGVEGVTFEIENGKRRYIVDNYVGDYGVRTSYGVWPLIDAVYMESYDMANRPKQPEGQYAYDNISLKMATKPHPPLIFTTDENARKGELYAAIRSIQAEYYDKFMVGTLDIDDNWDKFVREIEDAGLEEFLEITNAAYRRQQDFLAQ